MEPRDAAGDKPADGLPLEVRGEIKTLADVLAHLDATPRHDRRYVEMKSAVRKMGEALRRSLMDVPADPVELRLLIARTSRASAGLSKARWSRIRSLTLAALRDLGIDLMPGRDTGGLDDAWMLAAASLPTKNLRVGLSRFMSFCSRRGIGPGAVTESTFQEFEEALKNRSLQHGHEAIYRGAVRLWNRAVSTTPEWPQTEIPLAAHPHFYSMAWESFHPGFIADTEAFLSHSANADELDELEDHYVRSVKPSTIALRRRQIRQLASTLVASGFPVADLTSLEVLVRPVNARASLRCLRARRGGTATSSLGDQAWLLCTIAKYWVRKPSVATELAAIAKRVTVKPKGMNPRNRARLHQFDLRENVLELLRLPHKVVMAAERAKAGDIGEARRVMMAVAIEFLIVAPMRVGNLTSLEHERHLVEIGRGANRNRHIIIPPDETKTDALFDMTLPAGSRALLDIYLKVYRPRLCPVPSIYLFPNKTGGQRGTIPFSSAISKFIEDQTGLKMHAHLFRALAGKLHLDEHPEDIETVRRVLGHTTSATTIRYYLEQRTGQAFRRYDSTIAKLRDSAKPAAVGTGHDNARRAGR